MPRPRKPVKVEYLWQNLTAENLLESELAASLRELPRVPAFQAVLTVLVNERPSARGERDGSFILGYEACLARLRELTQLEKTTSPELPEPDYAPAGAIGELTWSTTIQKE